MFNKTVIPNGLRIITAPMKGTNTVTILVMCATGSDHEREEERGISHFLEHMFFKGTSKRKTSQEIMRELDSMGSISNAFTSHEYTGYYIKAGHVYLDQALDILADIYKNSLLDAEEIDRERQVIIEEMNKNRDNPAPHLGSVYQELLYGNQNAGWDIIGTENHIRSFSQSQFVDYFKSQYTAQNTVIIVAGNFDEPKTITNIKDLFGNTRDSAPAPARPFNEIQGKPALSVFEKKTDQSHILLGFRGISIHDEDRYAADILAMVLGGMWSSRMWDVVRERLGLAYTVHTSSQNYSNRGHLTTYAGVAHGNVEKTIQAMLNEYRTILENHVTEEELLRVKNYIKGSTLIGLESSDEVAEFVGGEELMTGRPLTMDEVFRKIEAIRPEDIQRVAKKIIRPEGMNLAILGPHGKSDSFENILKL